MSLKYRSKFAFFGVYQFDWLPPQASCRLTSRQKPVEFRVIDRFITENPIPRFTLTCDLGGHGFAGVHVIEDDHIDCVV
jgi:hypothetical protein